MKTVTQIIEELKSCAYQSHNENPYSKNRPLATDEDVLFSETQHNVNLPNAYKTFVRDFSNGIQLLEKENIFGVGSDNGDPLHDNFTICAADVILQKDKHEAIAIKPLGQKIQLSKLICFAVGNMEELSDDCWVFLCDETVGLNHKGEYKIGYLAKHNMDAAILLVLDSFEQWLNILWQYNMDKLDDFHEKMKNVFSILIPEWDDRMDYVDFIRDIDDTALTAIMEIVSMYS